MKKSAALLLLIGLMCFPAAYAQDRRSDLPEASAPAGTASRSSAPAKPATGQSEPRKTRGEDYVALNFTNVDISALVKVMSELTRRNFILDEKVTGKVTIMTPTKISPDEAYQVFLSALEIKGFTAVEDDKVIRIIPSASARQSGLKVLQDDNMAGEGFVTKLIRMNFVNPQEVVRTITPLVSRDGNVIPYPPTNSVIITDSVSNIRKLESLIHAMDVAAPEGKGKINVYYLKNANAEEIAKLMQALVARLPVPPPPGSPQAATAPASLLEGTVTITADKATNSLIIVGTPTDFETMKDVIQKLDIRRRQVYVEVAIIEMSLSKMRDLGFELQSPIRTSNLSDNASSVSTFGGTNFPGPNSGITNVIANGPAALASMSGLAVGAIKGTFTFQGKQYLSVGALLHALQTDGNVNVLSTPNLLTMDNQKAEIMVGQNVPFISGQTQNAITGSQTLFNTVNRQDVGIKLALTPQIASDDNVRLEVNQEISDVVAATLTNPAGPTTSKRSASTTIVVKDRQTMVIGGLIRDNVTTSESKVPFLGDIPILGWLFKSKTTSIDKTNLMIFITPYIIKNESEAADLTKQKNDALEDFRKEYRIEKKGTEPVILAPKPGAAPEQPAPALESGPTSTAPAKIEEQSAPSLQSSPTAAPPAEMVPAPAAEPTPGQPESSPSVTQQPDTGAPKEEPR